MFFFEIPKNQLLFHSSMALCIKKLVLCLLKTKSSFFFLNSSRCLSWWKVKTERTVSPEEPMSSCKMMSLSNKMFVSGDSFRCSVIHCGIVAYPPPPKCGIITSSFFFCFSSSSSFFLPCSGVSFIFLLFIKEGNE